MLAARPPSGGSDDADWDQKEMPFTEHLRELRTRLFICAGTVFGIAVLALWPAQQLIPIITRTYFHGMKLNAFGPADAVWAIFKFAIYIAIVIGLPVILYQIWMFVVPAIHPKTRKAVYIYVAPSIVLAAAGIAFAHFLVLPRVIGALHRRSPKLPVCGIAGIDASNAGAVIAAGADGVAVISALSLASDPAGAARSLREIVDGMLAERGK